MRERIERHNRDFANSHRCWFEAVYKDKYEYMGEFDLMSLAFTMDLGFYYLGIASQPFKMGIKALLVPPFSDPLSRRSFISSALTIADLPRSPVVAGASERSGREIEAGAASFRVSP